MAVYGLGIDGDFFVEYIRHRVDSGKIHVVEYQCRAAAVHSWPASGTPYSSKEIPTGVPDDLYVNAIDPDMRIVCGCRAWKYNKNITGARFRARYYATPLGTGESADLRTLDEGGDMIHDPDSGMIVVDTPFFANYAGAQYDFISMFEGVWYYTFQFTSFAGDSVWSDGNKRPLHVTDYITTDTDGYATGPPSDWWVEVKPDPSGRHAVIVSASRPKVNGHKIWSWVAQIKDTSTYGFHDIDADGPDLGVSGAASWCHEPDIMYGAGIDHAISLNNTRLTRESGAGLNGEHPAMNDFVKIGDLVLLDTRGGSQFDADYCQWGTVDAIQGLTSGFDLSTATHFDVQGRFRTDATSDLRLLVVTPPWSWSIGGYFGAESNHGLYEKWYWDPPDHGDTTTQVFVSDPIDVPASVDLANVGARVWFDNGFSRSDGGIYSSGLSGDNGNPSGAHELQVLTHADDTSIPTGYIVLQWHRDTVNYRGIYAIAVVLSSTLPAEGCYAAERAGSPTATLETGICAVTAGDKSITITGGRASNPDVVGRVFAIYTDDASPDSDLDANVIAAQAVGSITLTSPFNKSGDFTYAILKRWFDTAAPDTTNLAYLQFTPSQVAADIEQEVWRTQPIPVDWGTYEVTVYSRNRFGVGTRLTSAASTDIGGCIDLSVTAGHVATDVDQGRIFSVTSASAFTIDNPTGTLTCGITLLWKITGAGIPTLDTAFRLMDGEVISKSSGRDLLGAIYDGDGKWDAFWKKGS